ncbi:DNA-binding protein [Microbacterium pumilum]|uniref:Helix-turn-helix domain-containing protein n=1 Tax=Microbacterium pumilum TaxID=344165 RepID=A0ABN2SI64_9MICO
MFVITADQRDSRSGDDLVPKAIDDVVRLAGIRATSTPERTAGDELQVADRDADAVLAIVLHLTRLGTWSVGVGIGAVEAPLPASVRAGRGEAFVYARDAVERAKRTPTRLAVTGSDEAATDAEALVRLMVELRDRRTAEGWEVYDLLADGMSQRDAAKRLGITEGAVSLRAKAAGLRAEEGALPALGRVLAGADKPDGDGDGDGAA